MKANRNICTWKPTLLFLPRDSLPCGSKVYKYTLTVVNFPIQYKEAEPPTSKYSAKVVKPFQLIYKRSPFAWLQMLQAYPGHEFMGSVSQEMEKHKTLIRDQAIVERFNRTLAERLFIHRYAMEILLPAGSL